LAPAEVAGGPHQSDRENLPYAEAAMTHVQDLLSFKGITVYTIHPDASVYEATSKMNQHQIGALVVTHRDEPGRILGIFTERDVLRRVVAQLRYPDIVSVREVMTDDPVTACPDMLIEQAAAIMQEHRVRHLPVVDPHDRLCGMISIGDINAWHVHQAHVAINDLSQYIHGRT
jgi:CBS domain-containing protein